MNRLEGKTAIVTGGGTGIGKAICVSYAKEGADVAVIYSTSTTGAEDTVQKVQAEGRKAIMVQCDQSKPEDIKRMVKTVYDEFHHIDIVVNNASARDAADLKDYSVELWDHCMNTNVRGMFLIMQEVAEIMMKQGGGHIINVSSISALRPSLRQRAAYASSKSAITAMTAAAAEALGPYGIYVNTLSPGSIDTNIGGLAKTITNEAIKQREAVIPVRRRGVPEDIVGPAIFLACDDSRYYDGNNLLVDGGWANAD